MRYLKLFKENKSEDVVGSINNFKYIVEDDGFNINFISQQGNVYKFKIEMPWSDKSKNKLDNLKYDNSFLEFIDRLVDELPSYCFDINPYTHGGFSNGLRENGLLFRYFEVQKLTYPGLHTPEQRKIFNKK